MTTITSRIAAGMATIAFALVLALSAPHQASAWVGGYYNHSYPPAPNYYNTPSVQVIYPSGYYQNYFVPTVRYYPAPYPVPVPTTYFPTQPPVFTTPNYNPYPHYPRNYGSFNHNW